MFSLYEDMKANEKCQNWGALGVMGHPRLSETSPFDRAYMTSYLTNRNYASILYRFRVIARFFVESGEFNPPNLRWNFAMMFGVRKLDSPRLSCGIICMILRLAVLIQYRNVTHTDTRKRHMSHSTVTDGTFRQDYVFKFVPCTFMDVESIGNIYLTGPIYK